MKSTFKISYDMLTDLLGLQQHNISIEQIVPNDAQGIATFTVESPIVVPIGQRLAGNYKSHAQLTDIKIIDDK